MHLYSVAHRALLNWQTQTVISHELFWFGHERRQTWPIYRMAFGFCTRHLFIESQKKGQNVRFRRHTVDFAHRTVESGREHLSADAHREPPNCDKAPC